MTQPPAERLYQLLPAIYRIRDGEEGGDALRALLAVLEEERSFLEDDIDRLYDNWFIETCDPWVVSYIGDLLGVRELYPERAAGAAQRTYGQLQRRAYVANILACRRRKGTVPVLEQLARDITGWPARAVEFWQLAAASANLNRTSSNSTASLRPASRPELSGTPFEVQAGYRAEVRRIASSGGRYNLPNLGLFLWRLSSYPLEKVTAGLPAGKLSPELQGRCYTFSPLGSDSPLFNSPKTETEIIQLAQEINVPGKLPTRPNYEGYSGAEPAFKIFANGQPRPIPPAEVLIASLGNEGNEWQLPSGNYETKVVAVDPQRGRLAFLERHLPSRVEVSYACGFSGDIGGGPYERLASIPPGLQLLEPGKYMPPLTWQLTPTSSADSNPLAAVIQIWNGTVRAWQGIRELTCLPLAALSIPPAALTIEPLQQRSEFQAGRLSGLEVIATIGSQEVLVTPGVAVDAQGRTIYLDRNYSVKLPEQKLKLSLLPSQVLLLVIAYRSAREGENYQVRVILEAEAADYPAATYLPLAKLMADPQGNILSSPDLSSRPQFQPGIVSGFQVVTNPGTIEAIVTPGTAVDGRGRRLQLERNLAVTAGRLSQHPNQTRLLLLSHSATATGNWQLQDVAEGEASRYPEATYLRLAKLKVPQVTVTASKSNIPRFRPGTVSGLAVTASVGTREVSVAAGVAANAKGRRISLERDWQIPRLWRYRNQSITVALFPIGKRLVARGRIGILQPGQEKNYPECLPLAKLDLDAAGKVTAPPINLSPQFEAGIVEGLGVDTAGQAQIRVSGGKAVDSQGQPLVLEGECQVDLSAHPSRVLTFFISRQLGMGWQPLTVTRHAPGRQWQQLGAVPQEPKTDEPGIIFIRDNRTYEGNLEIEIPAGRQLRILAANGYRPHVRGDLSVQSSNPPETGQEKPSELTVNGLLLEGKLTVAAGYLQKLRIAHCTLVPERGGLAVERTEPAGEPGEGEEEWFLIGLISYYLNLLQQLIRLGVAPDGLPPQQRLQQLFQLACEELHRFFLGCQQGIAQWQSWGSPDGNWCECLQPTPPAGLPGADNTDLDVQIDGSICGPVHLAETVPQLAIADSIIDKGKRTEVPRPIAILALGTEAELGTTTVLGMTAVGKIAASDCLFGERVAVRRRQEGCLRFSLVPDGSQTPRRYQCQPDLLLAEVGCNLPAPVISLAIYETVILAATAGDGLFRLDNNQHAREQPWQQLATDWSDGDFTCLIAHTNPANETAILAGTTSEGISYSQDNGDNWLPTKLTQKTIHVLAAAPDGDVRFLAGTPEGVFATPDLGGDWQLLGELKLNVTALLVTASADIFAGTPGNGVFRYSPEAKSWEAVSQGLTDREVTVLGSSVEGEIFAGTEGGSVFRSQDRGETWELMTPDWMQWPVTSLAIKTVTGTISSHELTATISDIKLKKDLLPGCAIVAAGQVRIVEAVKVVEVAGGDGELKLTLNAAFCPDLPEGTDFSSTHIFIGTAGGGIFHSLDIGETWQQVNHDWTSLTVTTLAINVNTGEILAGTAAGSLIHSTDSGRTWKAFTSISRDVDKKLLLLNRLYPTFTSREYAPPGYAQLSQSCALEIRTGAENGSEMGAFNHLNQPQRQASLQASLQEYLPFGMEAGIFYVT